MARLLLLVLLFVLPGFAGLGDYVGVFEKGDTASAWALRVTRNANNWRNPNIKVAFNGKTISKNRYRRIPVGAQIIFPADFVKTINVGPITASITEFCQTHFTNPDCAWRIGKINQISGLTTVRTFNSLFVPIDFPAVIPAPNPVLPLKPVISPVAPISRPSFDFVMNLWWLVILLTLITLIAELILGKQGRSLLDYVTGLSPDLASHTYYTEPDKMKLERLAQELKNRIKRVSSTPIQGLEVYPISDAPILIFCSKEDDRKKLKDALKRILTPLEVNLWGIQETRKISYKYPDQQFNWRVNNIRNYKTEPVRVTVCQ